MKKYLNIENISIYRNEIYGICMIWFMLYNGVILNHVHLNEKLPLLDSILRVGFCGIDVVLFLMGLSVYYSLAKDDDYDHFIKKRLTHILPAYLIFGSISWIIFDLIIRGSSFSAFLGDISLYNFWKNGESFYWCIALILVLNLIAPLMYYSIFKFEDGRKKYPIFLSWLAAILIFNAYLQFAEPEFFPQVAYATCRVPVFLCGLMAGDFVYHKKHVCTSVYIASFAISLFTPVLCKNYLQYIDPRYTNAVIGISIAVTLSVLLPLMPLRSIHWVLAYFGSISLELYLVHVGLRTVFIRSEYYTDYCLKEYLVLLLITVVVASLLHKLVSAILTSDKPPKTAS